MRGLTPSRNKSRGELTVRSIKVSPAAGPDRDRRERLLRVLSAATFLIFLQAYMVAPLIPRLAEAFRVSVRTIGLIVPAYLIPYGLATLLLRPALRPRRASQRSARLARGLHRPDGAHGDLGVRLADARLAPPDRHGRERGGTAGADPHG